MTNDAQERTLPYPDEGPRTHWEGCWRAPKHHNCAVLHADSLLDALDREREANRELREAAEEMLDAVDEEVPDHGPTLAERAALEPNDGPMTHALNRRPQDANERWCDACMPEYGEYCDFGLEQTTRIVNRAWAARARLRALLHHEDADEGVASDPQRR